MTDRKYIEMLTAATNGNGDGIELDKYGTQIASNVVDITDLTKEEASNELVAFLRRK